MQEDFVTWKEHVPNWGLFLYSRFSLNLPVDFERDMERHYNNWPWTLWRHSDARQTQCSGIRRIHCLVPIDPAAQLPRTHLIPNYPEDLSLAINLHIGEIKGCWLQPSRTVIYNVSRFIEGGSTVNMCELDLYRLFKKCFSLRCIYQTYETSPSSGVIGCWLLADFCCSCVKLDGVLPQFFQLKFGIRQGPTRIWFISIVVFAVYIWTTYLTIATLTCLVSLIVCWWYHFVDSVI